MNIGGQVWYTFMKYIPLTSEQAQRILDIAKDMYENPKKYSYLNFNLSVRYVGYNMVNKLNELGFVGNNYYLPLNENNWDNNIKIIK